MLGIHPIFLISNYSFHWGCLRARWWVIQIMTLKTSLHSFDIECYKRFNLSLLDTNWFSDDTVKVRSKSLLWHYGFAWHQILDCLSVNERYSWFKGCYHSFILITSGLRSEYQPSGKPLFHALYSPVGTLKSSSGPLV